MPTITDIDVQKNNTTRYNIYIDNVFAFGVSENTLLMYRLHKGMVMTDDIKKEILSNDTFQKLYGKALNYISYALRSEAEVREKLLTFEEADDNLIDAVIEKLKEDKYVDDTFYADTFIQTALALTKKGKFAIEKALQKKHVPQAIITNALQQISEDDELQLAIEAAQKYQQRQHHLSQKELEQKIKTHLVQKGFSFSLASKVISHLNFQQTANQEWESLCVQGDKIWRRYQLKYAGSDLKYKMQGALYQKGFDTDLINRYIRQKLEEMND